VEYLITIATSVVSAILIFVLQGQLKENRKLIKAREEEQMKKDSALETGVRQLLCVRLEEIFDQYADSDNIPRRVFDRWMKLHQAYKGLHGNGTFDHMKEEIEGKHIINK
jgi:hypothetical protein